jgi:3-deoxy-D-manno-octulosonic-acid transferase
MLGQLYSATAILATPLLKAFLARRARRGKEDPTRMGERFGVPSLQRPTGDLIWAHAASVGEVLSLLPLLHRMAQDYPHLNVLVTTGTVTSATLIAARLPRGMLHHYVPIDHPPSVARFLDYWRPRAALWVESELWPAIMAGLKARAIPAVLINGRMSPASFRAWRRVRGWARTILAPFALCLTQTSEDAEYFRTLGARNVQAVGNLKYAAAPLPHDPAMLEMLREAIGGRPCWLFASTHAGEEVMAATVHHALKRHFPTLLTLIVPRHATRGAEITAILRSQNLNVVQRSMKGDVTPATDIYLADTMGELGLFYRLCPQVVMGGSFVPTGGHNPIEPAQLGCALMWGPHMHNFRVIERAFIAANAAQQFNDINGLINGLTAQFATPQAAAEYGHRAQHYVATEAHVLDTIMAAIAPILSAGKGG